jgi:hypothetical protein
MALNEEIIRNLYGGQEKEPKRFRSLLRSYARLQKTAASTLRDTFSGVRASYAPLFGGSVSAVKPDLQRPSGSQLLGSSHSPWTNTTGRKLVLLAWFTCCNPCSLIVVAPAARICGGH